MIYICEECHSKSCEHDPTCCKDCSAAVEEADPEVTIVVCTECGGRFCLECQVRIDTPDGFYECTHTNGVTFLQMFPVGHP